jgi:DNA topoisomerase I
LLQRFWVPFKQQVDEKIETVDRSEASGARELGIDPKSGKPVSVRLGRFGPYAAIGTKDDEEKPTFASLHPGQSMHTITLEQALELFKLPRVLGTSEDGEEELSVGIGRFGPFVKQGSVYASLKKEDDPYTIELPRAQELMREKKEFLANRIVHDFGNGVQILNGRYGPYITDGEKNARIPKDREPKSLTLAECTELLAAAPVRKGRGAAKKAAAKKAPAKKAATKKAATKKAPAKKVAKKATRKATKKVTKKAAAKQAPAKKAVEPASGNDEAPF